MEENQFNTGNNQNDKQDKNNPIYQDNFFNQFEPTAHIEPSRNILNSQDQTYFFPPFDVQPSTNTKMHTEDNYSSMFYPPFETPSDNYVAQPTKSTLLSLFQNAMSNPEERTALSELFRQLTSVGGEDKSSNNPQCPLLPNNSYTYTDMYQTATNNAQITTTKPPHVTQSTMNYYSCVGSPLYNSETGELAGQKCPFKDASPLRPDSELFDTVAQSSDAVVL
ncbi:uncharacterized protein LOC115231862 [Octopus sinensis]|uniref:Uncharacterized protein LOC115231862 n=1 Tax=Octopus sinensis TaxID=2607531 RepID=A0A6P7TYV2_9MOLL|nr:uncharacterized protein LOC115231862 [Octopus sinensis]